MSVPGLRERKKRETRLALSHAAIRLALERGLENVSVDEIAAAANVSARTFRNYFGSKAEAIVAAHVDRGQRIAEVLQERPKAEPLWDALTAAVVAQFEPANIPARGDVQVTDLQKLLAEPEIRYEVFRARSLAEAQLAATIAGRTGVADTDLYPELVAATVGAAVDTAMTRWTRNPDRSIVSQLHEVFDQIRAGLPTPG
ncbi:TetR/AcrR family transcriptional regulator [Pseudonocardia sp. TRM90224]|uniref:TetR/AcrR family transcriptional regulator n=1 Tax=Pseudonocardia sp. TRM90224 TaxID=2812678 RepID=UPI001E42213E|nr:TetR family transcriptional regulator [Pseudonocardia sp. TRM90224]